jgi:hypothetical protein
LELETAERRRRSRLTRFFKRLRSSPGAYVFVRRENDWEYGNGDENSNCSGGRGRIDRR